MESSIIINGRYECNSSLGEGGMASVFRAHDTRLERDVAIKLIQIDESTNKKVIKQFEKESRALAKLNHPNIIPILDFGKTPEWLYIVMPLVEGGTLKDRLGTPIPAQEAAALLSPIAKALAYAHDQNIIHRDVKPSNILISTTGTPMLSDFGIAKLLEESETIEMTGTLQSAGTPDYMAPECGLGLPATPSSDIYSLGVILFEMITGKKPFTGDSPLAIIHKHAYDTLPQPSSSSREIPSYMNGVIYKALAKQPDQRYSSMASFASTLETISIGKKVRVNAPQPSSQKSIKQRRLTGVWITLLFLVVAAGGLFVVDLQTGSRLQMSIGVISPTPTITLTPTPSPTATPLPTATVPPPTATPTVAYPMDIGTPYPQSGEVISPDNIDRLTLLSQGGYGVPLLVSYSIDDSKLFVCTRIGIVVYETQTYTRETFIKSDVDNTMCAFSSTAYLLATTGTDKAIRIWDMLSNTQIASIPTKLSGFTYLSFSPDGKLIVTSSTKGGNSYSPTTVIWDVGTQKLKGIIHKTGDILVSLDSQQVLIGNYQYIEYWNINQNKLYEKRFISNTSNILLSNDGSTVIAQSGGVFSEEPFIIEFFSSDDLQIQKSIEIEQLASKINRDDLQEYARLLTGGSYYYDSKYFTQKPFSITQDNRIVAAGNINEKIIFINIETKMIVSEITEKWISSIAFSNSGEQIAYSSISDRAIKITDLSKKVTIRLENYYGPIDNIPSSELLTGSGINIYDQFSDYFYTLKSSLNVGGRNIDNISEKDYRFLIDRGIIEAAIGQNILPSGDPFWDSELKKSKTGKYLRYLISPDKTFLATTDGFGVELWKKPTTNPVNKNPNDPFAERIAYYSHNMGELVFSKNSDYFADINGSVATVWHLDNFIPIVEIDQTKGSFRFSPDSSLVAWITNEEISFYNTNDGSFISTLPINEDSFLISPDWKLCVIRREQALEYFQVSDGTLIHSTPVETKDIEFFEFSTDQNYVVTANSRGILYIWGIPK